MMPIQWKKIHETESSHQAEIIKSVLETEGIVAVIIDKKDSAYLLGKFEIWVGTDEVLISLRILEEKINFG